MPHPLSSLLRSQLQRRPLKWRSVFEVSQRRSDELSYRHLLIGLSLLVGLMVRVSAAFGVALLLMYWTAHMDWPFIENTNNFIVDYHVVYAVVCVYLIAYRAGHVWGLDGWVEKLAFIEQRPSLRFLVA